MKPVHFDGSNTTFAADQPQYLPLPAAVNQNSREGEVISCWQLTWRERLTVLLNGKFFLSVWTFGTPLQPQRPSVTNPIFHAHEYNKDD